MAGFIIQVEANQMIILRMIRPESRGLRAESRSKILESSVFWDRRFVVTAIAQLQGSAQQFA